MTRTVNTVYYSRYNLAFESKKFLFWAVFHAFILYLVTSADVLKYTPKQRNKRNKESRILHNTLKKMIIRK